MSTVEFDQLVEPDHLRYELDDGELVIMPRPRPRHNRIGKEILVEMEIYLRKDPVGEVFNSECLFVLGPTTKRAPDVAFLRAERAAALDPNEDIPGGPDLAVEILSPSDFMTAMRRKIQQYFDAGTAIVWVIDPENRLAEIWRAPGELVNLLHEDGILTAEELLPGFTLPLRQILRQAE
jgi:Uma2 family endonuclease